MKSFFSIILFILMMFLSCTKNEEILNSFVLKGNYSGTFSRINTETGWCCSSEVTLSLTDSTFTGTSDQQYFPAICAGNIELNENKIDFENMCFWPAHFDWSLILSEKWNYEFNGNQLKIRKERGNIEDEYLLSKIETKNR